jgi:hypothetical protein
MEKYRWISKEPRFSYDNNSETANILEMLFCLQVQLEDTDIEMAKRIASTHYYRLHYLEVDEFRPNPNYFQSLIPSDQLVVEERLQNILANRYEVGSNLNILNQRRPFTLNQRAISNY